MDDVALARLGHLNLVEFCRESARWSGATGAFEERDGCARFATGTTMPALYNGALRIDPTADAAALVDQASEWFAARNRGWSLWVAAGDDDLAAAAEAAGLVQFLDYPEMVCDERLSDGATPDGLELRWVDDAKGMADFVAVNAAAYTTYGMPIESIGEAITDPAAFCAPYIQSIVAYDGSEAVAAAQTILSHGIAGVYWVGTLEGARGRGAGEAVTRAVTNRAFDLGAAVNTLQASSMGEPIYTRMGYRTLYRYRLFLKG